MTDSIADLKRQLQQLDELSRSGALPAEAAAPARADLQRRLLDAVMAAPETSKAPAPTPAARPSIKLLLGLTAFVVIFAGAGMVWRANSVGAGAAGAMAGAQAEGAMAGTEAAGGPNAATMAQVETMLAKLVERLKTKPDDADGWLMLGRSYSVLGRYGEAVSAYRKVLALKPKDGQAMADLADALAMSQNRNFAGEPQKLIDQALALDPDNL
jgi:cytochrome c-type biogenesis protein CcmH